MLKVKGEYSSFSSFFAFVTWEMQFLKQNERNWCILGPQISNWNKGLRKKNLNKKKRTPPKKNKKQTTKIKIKTTKSNTPAMLKIILIYSKKMYRRYDTKLHWIVRLQFWSGVLFHCHYSQVHSDLEGYYLLGFHVWFR